MSADFGGMEVKIVVCDCGFKLGIQSAMWYEAAIGVLGIIECPECKKELNNLIKALQNEE